MNRREFHRTVAATTASLALGGKPPAAAAGSAAVPPDPLPAGAAARLGCNRLWHVWPASNPGLNDMAFSPDGRHLATLGYQDSRVFVWSVPDGRAVADWEPQDVDSGGDLLWTDRGLYVASSGGLSLWEPTTASLIHRFAGEHDSMQGLARSADGRLVAATSSILGTVRLWDAATDQPVAEVFAEVDGNHVAFPECLLQSVAFSRCSRWLAAGGYRHDSTGMLFGLIHVWDLPARRHAARIDTGFGNIGRLAFTPAGQLLTAADWFGPTALRDVPDGRPVRTWPRLAAEVYRGLAATSGGRIAVQRDDGVRLWDPDPGRERLLCPARNFSHLAFSDDGKFVAVGARSGRIDLYDAVTGADLSPPDRHAADVGRIEFSADGTVCLVHLLCDARGPAPETVLRDTRTGARRHVTPPPDWRPSALAPVGTRIAGLQGGSRPAVWDWVTGQVWAGPAWDVRKVAWHPDGQVLAAVTTAGEVVTWRPATGEVRRQPVSSPDPVVAVAVAADGRAVALGGTGGLFVWRLDRDDPPHRLAVRVPDPASDHGSDYYRANYWRLAVAADGSSAAVTCGDGVAHAGPLAGDELRPVYTHPKGQGDGEEIDGGDLVPQFTSAGRLLIAGTHTALRDRDWWYTHVVIDAETGGAVWRSPPRLFWATALAVSPDGRALLTGHSDGTLLVWPLNLGPVAG